MPVTYGAEQFAKEKAAQKNLLRTWCATHCYLEANIKTNRGENYGKTYHHRDNGKLVDLSRREELVNDCGQSC
jgi:hypothetical protein